jgi:bifunctional DNA-binding transcriptional regulator/antitoxin component of YhaV-PrlF toxin-antitoxin module
MTISFKNDNKTPLVVPPAVRRRARFKSGQELEFRASGGVISIVPKLPAANGEYTRAQRIAIDAELREAEKGPFNGPFDTMDELIAHLKGRLAKPKRAKKIKTSR